MRDLETSLVNYLCPICGGIAEQGIVMNSLLTEEAAAEVKKLHNKNIGFSDKCCKECAKYKDEAVFFVAIDSEKSDGSFEGMYRTGQYAGVRKDADLVEHVKDYIITLKDGTKFTFIDINAGKEIGLWK